MLSLMFSCYWLFRFLNTLGTLFTFVTHDVNEKVDILENYLKDDPTHYKTIQSFLQYEVDNNLTKTKVRVSVTATLDDMVAVLFCCICFVLVYSRDLLTMFGTDVPIFFD